MAAVSVKRSIAIHVVMQFFKYANLFNMSYGKWVEYYHEEATPFSIHPSPPFPHG